MNYFLFLLLACANSGALYAQEQDLWDAQLTEVRGDVMIYAAGEDAEGMAALKDMPLETGDRIKVGSNGSAEISFEGKSVIQLRANSEFTLESTRRADTILRLTLGTLLAKIQSLAGIGQLHVRTPTAIAAVRGTEFGVEVSPENPEETYVGVFDEGKVEVKGLTPAAGPGELLLSNQETKVPRAGAPLAPYQLRQFSKHRQFVRSLRKKQQVLRKRWKDLPRDQRRQLRGELVSRMKENRQKAREIKRAAPPVKQQRKLRADQKKMEKFRESIRKRKRTNP